MQQRHSLIDQFSTFIHWEEDQFHHWQSIPRLQRNMQQYLDQDPSLTSTQYWGIFWHKRWVGHIASGQTSNPYRDHLYAYLQEPCYRAATDLRRNYQQRFELEISDYFGMGSSKFDKILAEFNPISNPNLAAHGFTRLKWRIIDELRKTDQSAGHTPWSLLLEYSETPLKEALALAGVVAPLLDEYLMAWDCYCAIHKLAKIKHKGKIQSPSEEQWEKITAGFVEVSLRFVEPWQIRKYVTHCAEALYQYLSPKPISLNQTVNEEGESELQDIVIVEPTALERLEEKSEQDAVQIQLQKIYVWLEQELTTLDVKKHRLNPQIKTILELYYGRNLAQIPISQELNISQSAISRNLSKIQEILGDRFIVWCPEHLGRSVEADKLRLSSAIEQWLQHYYQRNVGTL
jgi:RNA polymerase sigma factor (sigma-70 family)